MADYGRITIQNGKNYFYDDKTKKLGKEVQLKIGDTALDRNGNRNMWNGTTWISTRGGAVASKLTKKQNGSFTYYGRNDGTGYWKDSAGRRLAEDNILKIGNGNYKRLNPNGSQTILMENGQFTEDGNKLSELFKDNMRKGNVYDVRVSEVNGQKYSKARDIRTDQGEYNLARNIRVGWRNDTDFNTKQKSVNTIGNKEKAERERLNREALNIKPQLNWLQQAKSNSSKRIEEVAKAKEFENFISNELSKDARVGTGELLSEPTKIDYTTPFKDQYSPESFFEQPAAVGDKNLKRNKAIQKYIETRGANDYQKALKGQETINTSKTLDRSATQLAQTGVGLMATTVAAPYILQGITHPLFLDHVIPTANNLLVNPVKNIIMHPIENIIAPQVASYGISKGLDKTNLGEKEKEIISTSLGFVLGQGLTNKAKDVISKQLLKKGYGHLYEGNTLLSKGLHNQLKSSYLTLKDAGNKLTWGLSNSATYAAPAIVPATGQYLSYKYTGQDLGTNIEEKLGLNKTVGNFIAEGLLGAQGSKYFRDLNYAASSMSGGKQGFKANWDFFKDKSGKLLDNIKFVTSHKNLSKLAAPLKLVLARPGTKNYQMSTIESTNKSFGTTKYTPIQEGDVSKLKFVRNWFTGKESDLGGELKTSGTIMLGNKDTSTGNEFEQLAKALGANDGRFGLGQRARVITPNDNGETVELLRTSKFVNPETKQYEDIFIDGKLNPNIVKLKMSSENNMLVNSRLSSNNGGTDVYRGTMVDINGHQEIPIRDKEGNLRLLHIDTQGPGSGGKGGNAIVKSFSRITSRQEDPSFFIGVSGNRQLITSKTGEISSQVAKNTLPIGAKQSNKFIITSENIGINKRENQIPNNVISKLYGDIEQYKEFANKIITRNNKIKKNEELAEKLSPKKKFGLFRTKAREIDGEAIKNLRSTITRTNTKIESERKLRESLDKALSKATKENNKKEIKNIKEKIAASVSKSDSYQSTVGDLEKILQQSQDRTPSLLEYLDPKKYKFNQYWNEAAKKKATSLKPVKFQGIEVPLEFKQYGGKLNKLRELKRGGILTPVKKVDWEEYQKQNRKWKN